MKFVDCRSHFVFGLARSGRAIAALLAERGRDVRVFDEDADALSGFAGSEDCRRNEARLEVVDPDTWRDAVDRSDCVVASPGVPLDHALLSYARERGKPVVGEIEAACHFTSARIVGVTGTNGKSTVVGVIGAILSEAGHDVVVAGNIGNPLADVLRRSDPGTLVLELSSFQLDTINEFRVDVAVLLNVTPDHLDRYNNSFDEYAASKARILNRASSETVFVYNDDDETVRSIAGGHNGTGIPFSASRRLEPGVFFDDGAICRSWRGSVERVIARSEFTPVGLHNLENAMAAVGAVTPLDAGLDAMRSGLRGYRPLPHRMELVRVADGVAYVNDSKATNVDAAVKSLVSIDGGVALILGGRDKDGDFKMLIPYLGRVKVAILIGEAAPDIRAAIAGHCDILDAPDLAAAVRAGRDACEPGDTVLLAPACASFDMFENYQERGKAFRAAAKAL